MKIVAAKVIYRSENGVSALGEERAMWNGESWQTNGENQYRKKYGEMTSQLAMWPAWKPPIGVNNRSGISLQLANIESQLKMEQLAAESIINIQPAKANLYICGSNNIQCRRSEKKMKASKSNVAWQWPISMAVSQYFGENKRNVNIHRLMAYHNVAKAKPAIMQVASLSMRRRHTESRRRKPVMALWQPARLAAKRNHTALRQPGYA